MKQLHVGADDKPESNARADTEAGPDHSVRSRVKGQGSGKASQKLALLPSS